MPRRNTDGSAHVSLLKPGVFKQESGGQFVRAIRLFPCPRAQAFFFPGVKFPRTFHHLTICFWRYKWHMKKRPCTFVRNAIFHDKRPFFLAHVKHRIANIVLGWLMTDSFRESGHIKTIIPIRRHRCWIGRECKRGAYDDIPSLQATKEAVMIGKITFFFFQNLECSSLILYVHYFCVCERVTALCSVAPEICDDCSSHGTRHAGHAFEAFETVFDGPDDKLVPDDT